MVESKDVYISFRKAQACFLQRPFVIPKNWDNFIKKMPIKNKDWLENITLSFNTRYQNVDIDMFFDCGFELFGRTFTYSKFFERKIILLYIEKDKNIKRSKQDSQEIFKKDKDFIYNWVTERPHRNDISIIKQYCMLRDDGIKAPIKHFLLNKISKYTLVWLLSKKYLILNDDDKSLIPLIMKKYWSLAGEMAKMKWGEDESL